ncbi:MAG TPA: hypothetical protein VE954_25435 [Oligoflexus sp.]|uniref:hypothetical protein n=1 Tax=Oligoflexus sp. TaxID=1971216 RepID=UPI002D2C050B|nr:hypothetical protein [Oligoflexus sp.]HYX36464.1 hypothetical protein [Oligoflexus sp.]
MVRVGLRKEQIKSILLCKDRDFKRKAVGHLNNSAFAAEKFVVEHMADALEILDRDLDIENFIVDASPHTSDDIKQMLDLYQRRTKNPDVRFLFYLDEAYQSKEKDVILQVLPRAQVFFLPPQQNHFNKAFHGGRAIPDPPAPSASEQAAKEGPALTLIETSSHIKETVELLNSVSKDRSRLDILKQIGQRFNGIIGTFAFFVGKPGYGKVKDLATIIDDVSRTYEDSEDHKDLTEKHWQLLMESAKTLYLILKDLRENRPLTTAYVDKANSLIALYQKDGDIRKRSSQTQDEVDRIVDVAAEIFKHSS